MAPTRPRKPPKRRTVRDDEVTPLTEIPAPPPIAEPIPRRPPADKIELPAVANKRRGVPQPWYDIPISRTVEEMFEADPHWATWAEFGDAVGVDYDNMYRSRALRRAWPAWVLNRVAAGLGVSIDGLETRAGLREPARSLREAILTATELDKDSRAVLLENYDGFVAGRSQGGRGGRRVSGGQD